MRDRNLMQPDGLIDVTTLHIWTLMRSTFLSIRDRLDRVGVLLSGACAVHCVLSVLLVSVLGLGGEALLSPAIHRVGLVLAVLIGAIALGYGVRRHGRTGPMIVGGVGLGLMTLAVFVGHGFAEAVLTICGVSLVAAAHIWNLKGAASC